MKQAYDGLKPILAQLETVSAAGVVVLFSLFEYAWDEIALRENIVKIINYPARRVKILKFTLGWKKDMENEGEPRRELILTDNDIFNKDIIFENRSILLLMF